MTAPEGSRNWYRRFNAEVGQHDGGWVTGPVYGLLVQYPGVAGLFGLALFGGKAVEELTQQRPFLLVESLATILPSGLVNGVLATKEILATGNLEQAGFYVLAALGSAALIAGTAYLERQADLGIQDAAKAESERYRRSYSPRYRY